MQSQGGDDDGELEGGKEREMQRHGLTRARLRKWCHLHIDQPLGGKESKISNLTPGFLGLNNSR